MQSAKNHRYSQVAGKSGDMDLQLLSELQNMPLDQQPRVKSVYGTRQREQSVIDVATSGQVASSTAK